MDIQSVHIHDTLAHRAHHSEVCHCDKLFNVDIKCRVPNNSKSTQPVHRTILLLHYFTIHAPDYLQVAATMAHTALFHPFHLPLINSPPTLRPIRPTPRPSPIDTNLAYRQLISRAVTQRLHSPTLDISRPADLGDSTLKWEFEERLKARRIAKGKVREIGVSWGKWHCRRLSVEERLLTLSRWFCRRCIGGGR